jgi:ABC-type histidine transport system ATPase subunit
MVTVKQEPLLRIEELHKRFDDHVVLAGVGLDVQRGTFLLAWPSGAASLCS